MTTAELVEQIAGELSLPSLGVARTVALLDDDNTIPFIARYRKEVTGGLDEVQLEALVGRLAALRALEARREEVLRLIGEQGKMTADLDLAIRAAQTLQTLEDLYLPFRPRRRTRAMIARERGLDPLASLLLDQVKGDRSLLAGTYVDEAGEVPTVDDAWAGARDIVAEVIAEDAEVRGDVRRLYARAAVVGAAVADTSKDPDRTYQQYYEFSGPLAGLPAHRVLALNRAEREGVLRVSVNVDEATALAVISRTYPADDRSSLADDLRRAAADSFQRLLGPSLEREIRSEYTARAEAHATEVFARNLRPLLLQPPLRGKTVIGIDPGYRTGCKVAVVDETGKPLERPSSIRTHLSSAGSRPRPRFRDLARKHGATVFAVGTGTASRETEEMVSEIAAGMDGTMSYAMVDEAGASVYSVSEVAREEFPDLDATERGAISIARRVQDPLAELVKVDPRAVGVGLYQHDVEQKALAGALDVSWRAP